MLCSHRHATDKPYAHDAGNKWSLSALSTVILCGMVAALVPMALKVALHDSHALGAEAEALTVGTALPPPLAPQHSRVKASVSHDAVTRGDVTAGASASERSGSSHAAEDDACLAAALSAASLRCELADAHGASQSDLQGAPSDASALTEPLLPLSGDARIHAPSECCAREDSRTAAREVSRLAFWVPFLISLSDVLGGLAAGMTIKFFPIFFMDEVRAFFCFAALCSLLQAHRGAARWPLAPLTCTVAPNLHAHQQLMSVTRAAT